METTPPHSDEPNPSPANSPSQTPPLTPKPVSRPDPNPHPTTFVQADTNSFKQVVQMLTGSSKTSIPPIKTGQQKKQCHNKLYERRNSLKTGLMINPLSKSSFGNGLSPRLHEMMSPSFLDFPALVLSPVTPLKEEERGIVEKGFFIHPGTPRGTVEPKLLPLFPVTSPRVTESSS